jgi:Fe-S-cluster-containing dehydrogenase component
MMETSRRDFLRMAGVSALTLIVPAASARATSPAEAGRVKRWAMAVDTFKCRDNCTECFSACHKAHNVPDFGNPKDEVKWIWPEPLADVFPSESHRFLDRDIRNRRLPILCNQCANPPCVRVCPTKATFQRPDGIVMMDYHRCIGCRFCMAACPYGARSMNYRDPRPYIRKMNPDFPTRTKGVVEKCNFCEERLVRGLLPVCVLACPEKALLFGDMEDPRSVIRRIVQNRVTLRRRAVLGTEPQVYYIL